MKLRNALWGGQTERIRLEEALLETRQPQIGDTVPNVRSRSTHGYLNLHEWVEGKWFVLFSHPAAFTSVCTTELAALAARQDEFDARDVRLIGICRSSAEEQDAWHQEIKSIFGVEIGFPMISDRSGTVSSLLGMIHPHEDPRCTIRKTMIVDPALRVRLIQEYPMAVGRSTDETLRAVAALQAADEFDVLTGADWQPHDEVLVPPGLSEKEISARYGATAQVIRDYLRTVDIRGARPRQHPPAV